MLTLDHLLTFTNPITVQAIGLTPFGQRTTFIVGEGTFEGPRLRGKILPGGGDWMLEGSGGLCQLDVRKTFETDDGALIDVRYIGLYRYNDTVNARLAAGQSCEFGDTLFQVQVRFETGAEKYHWLNETLAVGEGRETSKGVIYRLYAIASTAQP